MWEIFFALSSLEFCEIAADMTFPFKLLHHMRHTAHIFVPNGCHFKLLHINIDCNIDCFLIPNGYNRVFVQYLLRNYKLNHSSLSRLTFDSNGTTHFPNKGLWDCKSQTNSVFLTFSARIYLIKARKQFFQIFFFYSDSCILNKHRKIYPIAFFTKSDSDGNTAFLRKLYRIIHQIQNDSS